MVLVVIGDNASGKSTFSKYANQFYNYKVYEVGDYVRRIYKASKTKLTLLSFSNSFFEKGEIDKFLKIAIQESKIQKNKRLLFSGLRTYKEFRCLQHAYPDLFVIHIVCSFENRSKRYFKLEEDYVTIKERNEIEGNWMSSGWENVQINYEIDNNGSIDEFYRKISYLFKEIIKDEPSI